jgi:ABC-type polysaccharide/polyol phosphate export permease
MATIVPRADLEPLAVPGTRRLPRRNLVVLVANLAHRELAATHRLSAIGWLWPLARQLAQLAVLVFLFSNVLDLGIDDYALFVFCGLLVWSWFAAALTAGTAAHLTHRHFVMSPGFPPVVLPLVAVAVPLLDLFLAIPVVLVMLIIEDRLSATALLLPLLLALQFAFTAGLALLCAAANVYVRDVQQGVALALLLLFYLTPVFYGLKSVPERFQTVLELNPLTSLVEAVRAVLMDGELPSAAGIGKVVAATVLALGLGAWAHKKLAPGMVDEL